MTMLSRVMGLLRDVIVARFFGASEHADAFFVAFRIPQFLRRLFAEGAFAQAFVPVLAEYRQSRQQGNELAAIRDLINAVCGVLGGALFLLTIIVVMAAPLITMLFAPGFINQPQKFDLTVSMLRITFPYLLLISLTGFAGAILNSYGRFIVPAFTPVLLNFSLIGFALWVSPQLPEPIFAMAWAVLFAGFAQLLFQLPFLYSMQLLPRPVWHWHHPGVRKIRTLMLPAIFGVSVSQINLLLDTVLASFLPSGSVSWLYYSDRLAELPLGVFGIAIATVILPSLARLKFTPSENQEEQKKVVRRFRETIDWGLRCIVVIALPATAALILMAQPILFLLFQYDAMLPRDVFMSAVSLQAYALGLIAFMAIKVLATAYYAQQDMKTPVRIGVIAMVSNMILNLVFVSVFHFQWGVGHVGLALATSASALLNATLLYRGLAKTKVFVSEQSVLLSVKFWKVLFRSLIATTAMSVMIWSLLPDSEFWVAADLWQRLLSVAGMCGAGLFVYTFLLLMLGVRKSDFMTRGSGNSLAGDQ